MREAHRVSQNGQKKITYRLTHLLFLQYLQCPPKVFALPIGTNHDERRCYCCCYHLLLMIARRKESDRQQIDWSMWKSAALQTSRPNFSGCHSKHWLHCGMRRVYAPSSSGKARAEAVGDRTTWELCPSQFVVRKGDGESMCQQATAASAKFKNGGISLFLISKMVAVF